MALDAAARTHAGKTRTSNEDAWLCRPAAGLFAVVDGLGGEEAGEVAAAIAVAAIAEVPDLPDLPGETILAQALRVARDRVLDEADRDEKKDGMGAVATALRFDDAGQVVSIAHVGDTRAYLVHAGGVRVLTHDHVAEGPAGKKRQVARDLGRRDLKGEWVETSRARVARGDLLVLCSDGLHDVVGAEELANELLRLRAEAKSADAVATRLVGMALSGGGPDNVTVVAVRVGRFRRGAPVGPRARVWAVGAVVAALALGAGAWWLGRAAPTGLPAAVTGDGRVIVAEVLGFGAGASTVVAEGATFAVVGARMAGSDWSIEVAPGGAARLERVVLAPEREVAVAVGPGAELLVRDVRLESGRLRLRVPEGGRVVLEHLVLPSAEALVVEGAGVVARTDVRVANEVLPAPGAPGAPPPAPGAPSSGASDPPVEPTP